jgi:hypothetical protein
MVDSVAADGSFAPLKRSVNLAIESSNITRNSEFRLRQVIRRDRMVPVEDGIDLLLQFSAQRRRKAFQL